MSDPLSILTVHAHPDDEASKGAGTIARYAAEGIRTTLVCCTGGEEGDILNPAMDRPEVKDDLPAVRARELKAATEAIGYGEVVMLGYRDSGMPDSEANARADAFANAPADEAVGRLVEVIRRVRPQVVVTYPENQKRYPHPDHLRVFDITYPAVDAAADPDAFPGTGDPWQVSKIYCTVWSRQRMLDTHQAFLDRDLESPFDERWFEGENRDHEITAQVPVENRIRRAALLAHETQVDPTSPFWFGLPEDVQDAIHPYDDYRLLRSTIPVESPEDDLFAGLRG